MNILKIAKLGLLGLLALSTIQCGVESESMKLSKLLTLTPVPESPIVINADITIDKGTENERTIKAPWTRFKFNLNNQSGQKFRILTFTYYATSTKGGGIVKAEGGFDFGSQSGEIYGDFESNYNGTHSVVIYLGSLPEADSFVYTVEFEAQGYFLDSSGEPVNRLNLSTTMVTQ